MRIDTNDFKSLNNSTWISELKSGFSHNNKFPLTLISYVLPGTKHPTNLYLTLWRIQWVEDIEF